MSLIALFCDKGSPGVTTLGLALALSWSRRVALVECDPAGGDLAMRLTDPTGRPVLRPQEGLLSLAAAARRDETSAAVTAFAHGQPIAGLVGEPVVLAGVTSPEQGAGCSGLWPAIAAALARGATGDTDDADDTGDVLADLGRLHPGSPAFAVAQAADVLVGVGRASPESMLRLRDRFTHLVAALPSAPRQPRMCVALVVEDRRAAEATAAMRAVAEYAGLPVAVPGFLAVDPGAVHAVQQGRRGPRVHRSLLLRTARALAAQLHPPQTGHVTSTGRPAAAAKRGRPALVRTR